jgi:hypothetical protein
VMRILAHLRATKATEAHERVAWHRRLLLVKPSLVES